MASATAPTEPATAGRAGASPVTAGAKPDKGKPDKGKAAKGKAGSSQKSKKKLLLLAPVVLVVVAAAALKLGLIGKSKHPAHPVALPPGAVVQLPTLTTNLSDGHLVQLGLAAQLAPGDKAALLDPYRPRIDNLILSTYASWTYQQLLTSGGRALAKSRLLAQVQAIVGPSHGPSSVTALYYTTFVMQ